VGRSQLTVAPAPWNTEIKAIAGWHSGPWRVAANVNVDTALSANGGPATVEVTSRLARDIGHDIALGVEAYDTLGRISRPGPLNYFEQSVYLTADVPAPGFDLHVGVGRGLTSAADPWVVKAILGFKFGAEH
jgi:hypothetical protein